MTTRGPTGGVGELVGRVGGAVLAAIRASVGQTQEACAEHLHVGLSTVQAWKSGRRPLVNATFQDLQRLNRCLRLCGAAQS
jgi:DNA-binding transcriptional regulator YiaG